MAAELLGLGILTRANSQAHQRATPRTHRLHRVFEALDGVGVRGVPVLYTEEVAEDVRKQLLELDGVLVWVDPISGEERDRSQLDPLLREVAAQGVWVSTHPDVILQLGTKEVLHRTRALGWGTDTRLYRCASQLREELPRALAAGGARVLKQHRGNGGMGVFRVELSEPTSAIGTPAGELRVRVQHAELGSEREELPLEEFIQRSERYFAASGRVVDQPFQARHAEGMVRCYLIQDRVAGFGHQFVTALADPQPGESAPPAPPPRLYYGPAKPEFQALRTRLEAEWVPQMQALLGLETASLPAIWDADFLLGPKSAAGEDTYVLCEINVSSVFPFPDDALEPLARCALAALRAAREARA